MKCICVAIITACLCSACLEESGYNFKESLEQKLVVEGGLTTEFKTHRIMLGLSGKVTGQTKYMPATGATVSVTDGVSTYAFIEADTLRGHYVSDSIAAIVGKTYGLTIMYGGKRYEARASVGQARPFEPAAYSPMPAGSRLGKGFYQMVLQGNFGSREAYIYQLVCDIPDDWKDNFPYPIPPEFEKFPYYSQPVDTSYLVHQGLEPAALFEYAETSIVGLPLGTNIYEKRYSVSEEYYDFLRSVLMETDWRGVNIMQTIPADLPTNISHDAYGFFYVMDVYEVRSVIEE